MWNLTDTAELSNQLHPRLCQQHSTCAYSIGSKKMPHRFKRDCAAWHKFLALMNEHPRAPVAESSRSVHIQVHQALRMNQSNALHTVPNLNHRSKFLRNPDRDRGSSSRSNLPDSVKIGAVLDIRQHRQV